MERKFKLEVGQYVVVKDKYSAINPLLPKYPCKIKSRSSDEEDNVYILGTGEDNGVVCLETSLALYEGDIEEQMRSEILDLQRRVKFLEDSIDRLNTSMAVGFSNY